MPAGRRTKLVKPPSRVERSENLRQRIVGLTQDLIDGGFGAMLVPPGAIELLAEPVLDPKTGGWIGHVQEPLGAYVQRVSVTDNFSQRPPFDHVNDPIYRRLIRDFISPGATMPEAKVAALRPSGQSRKAESLEVPDIYCSIVDGLQRLYCYCISILLVWKREELLHAGLVPKDAWDYLSEAVAASGDPKSATEALLQRTTRYEVFYNIDLGGLLHYMVTFNTGQRRMSLPIQLEIMQGPLIQELEGAGIPIWHDIQTLPGMKQPKEKFAASTLVLATQAFITNNAQVTASTEAENFLNESQQYLDNVGDIDDVAHTIHRITTELHPEIMRVYADDPNRRFILSGGTFLLGLAAACGYIRNRSKMKTLDQALDRLFKELKKSSEDPWNLTSYQQALSMITTSRGKATRRLVYDTFLRFFGGATSQLEWLDTAAQITGTTF